MDRIKEIMFSHSRSGDISEHKAVVWLLEQGYEVFRNECCTGPIDIIAYNVETQEILKIDVKTCVSRIKQDGTEITDLPYIKQKQRELGIKLLAVDKINNTFTFID
jgi:Holliday junction resolvase-like predicted endonuclease